MVKEICEWKVRIMLGSLQQTRVMVGIPFLWQKCASIGFLTHEYLFAKCTLCFAFILCSHTDRLFLFLCFRCLPAVSIFLSPFTVLYLSPLSCLSFIHTSCLLLSSPCFLHFLGRTGDPECHELEQGRRPAKVCLGLRVVFLDRQDLLGGEACRRCAISYIIYRCKLWELCPRRD